VDDVTVKQDRTLIGEAFADVEQLSGGDLEIGVFWIEPAAPADPVALLGALPLDCLRGARELEWCGVDVATALSMLYAIAAYGAEGNVGMGGPRGRLHAWRSLAGLAGSAPGSPLPEIEARANLCRFTWFRRAYEYPPQYEMALLSVRPSGQEVAVVAASTGV
jgi:hypothetical protein